MPWISIGLLSASPDQWGTTLALAESQLIRISWLKGNAPLSAIKSRFLLRRKFASGEVSEAKILYASDESLVIDFLNFGQNYQVQVKKLIKSKPLTQEPSYHIGIEFWAE